ncbi:hypothetical protein [Kurthia huakuii]|uniref:hypothetical protein n=1 Tax=Kurthia huakuii TaxID=1421019 RepID=UPI0004951142|nr:hypothetical protein [Kurthia huakuii]MBM7699784.1 hypothetical protein [Kurthia huakuii]
MTIQLASNHYLTDIKKEGMNRLTDDLFLGKKKKTKASYEIKKEHGYIRHYVTKVNGEKIIVKETKLPKSQEHEQHSGEIKDIATELLMKQLSNVLDKEQLKQLTKTGLAGQKAKQLEKYSTSI